MKDLLDNFDAMLFKFPNKGDGRITLKCSIPFTCKDLFPLQDARTSFEILAKIILPTAERELY